MTVADLTKDQDEGDYLHRRIKRALLSVLGKAEEFSSEEREKISADFAQKDYCAVVASLDDFAERAQEKRTAEELWRLSTLIGMAYVNPGAYFSRQPLNTK